ncbi:molybdate-binding protein [Streptomyces sp. CNQ-509]|uniref:molybdate ABC transporter substrate-binding protein n=1 Tax=Streptomyces sp. CNQ-509 TaxID=444103 RepID=UPI00062DEE66|nr:molybdate ABC transporter substrate-binding protein [Streptomyces sp. CNQ-509]AKH83644.1 molybdate-binding protein [Streptomyces sp. CNQ-509]
MTRSARRTGGCRPTLRMAGAGAAALLALTACSDSDPAPGSDPGKGGESGELSGEVTVFAAASLTESFEKLGAQFEKDHPGTNVTFSFGGSDALAASITGGAPADVFASASPTTMEIVADAGAAAGTPETFVRNRLEIATLPGNPDGIASLKDLTDPGLKVVICDETVPCGSAVRKALDAGALKLTPVSYEEDVKSALTKVMLKEADAAVVYKTDVRAAGGTVEGVDFPESAGAINDYPITLLEEAPNAAAAEAFVGLVQSAAGQKVLTEAGFLKP